MTDREDLLKKGSRQREIRKERDDQRPSCIGKENMHNSDILWTGQFSETIIHAFMYICE